MKTNMIQNTNNKAIRLLQEGEFRACQLKCKIAIECILEETNDDGSDSFAFINSDQEIHAQGPVGVELEGPLFNSDPLSSPGNLFSVYNMAFALPTVESSPNATQFQDQERLSTVLFYNMALANHCEGLTFSLDSNSTESLKSALRLYQMSFATIQANAELVEERGFFLLLLGLVNNMGHIYSHLCMHEKAHECANYLEMITTLPIADEMHDDEMDFFINQLTFCSFHHCIAAPAA